MATIATRWNQFTNPESSRRAKNISPVTWECYRGLVTRLHHDGLTKQEILEWFTSHQQSDHAPIAPT